MYQPKPDAFAIVGNWISRASAVFCGVLAALFVFAVFARLYIEWELTRAADNIERALKKMK